MYISYIIGSHYHLILRGFPISHMLYCSESELFVGTLEELLG